MTWRTFAACADSGVDFFDPDQTNQALMLCHVCPVTDECLREALSVGSKDDPAGVWGGHTKAERDRMRPRGRKVQPCGTYAAYVRHNQAGREAVRGLHRSQPGQTGRLPGRKEGGGMRLLDLFCGAGGAAMGYHRAGFTEIIGIDIDPQPDYPFEFVKADALHVAGHWDLGSFDLIHASPPCQAHSALTKGTNAGRQYPDLIEGTRWHLGIEASTPYVIENVAGAPIRKDVMLCGEMFGLGVIRHRYFELNGWQAAQPAHAPHRGRVRGWRHGTYYDGPYLAVHGDGGGKGSVDEWQDAMDIEWTDNRKSIAEAIPPAYTEWIGRAYLEQQAAA